MLRRTMWLSGLVLVLAATAAHAQDAKKGRGGFGQGPGGFGGLGGFRASGAQLLGIAEVQKELSVSDEQKGLLEDMQAEMRRGFGGGGAGGFDFQNASDEERRKFFEEMQKRGVEQAKKADEMISMILEPKQLDRLNQLKVQRDGVFGLVQDDMAKKLGLSDEQKEKMTKLRDDAMPRFDGGGAGGFQAFRNLQNASDEEKAAAKAKMQEEGKKMQERMDKARTDMLAVLTAEQKDTFDKLQGKKFEFPGPQFGFGGGRPGGQGDPNKKKKNDK